MSSVQPETSFWSRRRAFWRESSWMVAATTGGGVLMYLVHAVAKEMTAAEYGVFNALLQIINLMGIPAIGLQSVFAQQAASALTEARESELQATTRGVLKGIFVLWLVVAIALLIFQGEILSLLQIANPAALWMTVLVALAAMWMPLLLGLLQGLQDFLWYGWAFIFNGAGRLLFVMVAVLLFNGQAAGAMAGVLAGIAVAVLISGWRTRSIWGGSGGSFEWSSWLGRVVPMTLGLGTPVFMMSADMVVVQSLFDRNGTGAYAAAGMIGRGLYFFTIPLTAVMFPKIVRSAAKSEKTDVMIHVLLATALMGGSVALFCTIFPQFPLQVIYQSKFRDIAWLVPWFCWSMVPLTLATVLVHDLMARGIFRVVPYLLLIPAGYFAALTFFHSDFKEVVKVLGFFNLLLLGVAFAFNRMAPRRAV